MDAMSENPITNKEPQISSKPGVSFEWLLKGSLSRLGDIFDSFTRRKEPPPNSLATSQLVERLKRLLDSMAKVVPEKGTLVPHIILLKIQWDKFATDENDTVDRLQNELLAAAVDHINDSQYYTLAPIDLKVVPDYFTDGVKLVASFDTSIEARGDELNVTISGLDAPDISALPLEERRSSLETLTCHVSSGGTMSTVKLAIPSERRITIGRSGGNDLSVDDPSISKFHGSISIAPDGSMSVADTGSTNGTFINGGRIAYGKSIPFDVKDVITFGTVEVKFEIAQGSDIESGLNGQHSNESPDLSNSDEGCGENTV
jgi:hypothetical protein